MDQRALAQDTEETLISAGIAAEDTTHPVVADAMIASVAWATNRKPPSGYPLPIRPLEELLEGALREDWC